MTDNRHERIKRHARLILERAINFDKIVNDANPFNADNLIDIEAMCELDVIHSLEESAQMLLSEALRETEE